MELRKSKKDDMLSKRRNVANLSDEDSEPGSPLQEVNANRPMMSLDQIMEGLISEDQETLMAATTGARKILSRERNPPIDNLIQAGAVPMLVNLLARQDNTRLQFEAAWALTNIASGTSAQTKVRIKDN